LDAANTGWLPQGFPTFVARPAELGNLQDFVRFLYCQSEFVYVKFRILDGKFQFCCILECLSSRLGFDFFLFLLLLGNFQLFLLRRAKRGAFLMKQEQNE